VTGPLLHDPRTRIALLAAGLLIAFGAGWVFASARGDGSTAPAAASSDQPSAVPSTGPSPVGSTITTPTASASVPTSAAALATPTTGADSVTTRPSGTVPDAPIARFSCPTATVQVSTAAELISALRGARPGTVIQLHDGVYSGEFTATASGTKAAPIYLCGSRAAILQGDGFKGGYVLHFNGAAHWRVAGFTVLNGQKGVMVDAGTDLGLQGLLVEQIGDEAVHLRRNSTDNVVRGLTIRNTGNRKPKFGEGIYVGSATSNWSQLTGGQPDHSDRNFVLDNVISATTAESIDVKEGTSDGVIAGNTFDGAALSGADSWVDIKGNGWLIAGNRGRTSTKDGFQTHVILDGWGDDNLFTDNQADLNGGSGVGYYLHRQLSNEVNCTNTVSGASGGLSNFPCTR
jgi:hypothetical protein